LELSFDNPLAWLLGRNFTKGKLAGLRRSGNFQAETLLARNGPIPQSNTPAPGCIERRKESRYACYNGEVRSPLGFLHFGRLGTLASLLQKKGVLNGK
jgi:hypothetical protein